MSTFEAIMAGRCEVRRQNLCETCIGACCMAGNVLELTSSEATYMNGRGTSMRPLRESECPSGYKPDQSKRPFLLVADCANLDPETRKCMDYRNRPQVCRELPPDNREQSTCHNIRRAVSNQVESGVVDLPMPVVLKFDAMTQSLSETTRIYRG